MAKPLTLKTSKRFSRAQLLLFSVAFAAIGGYVIYTSLAAGLSKVWDSQSDFSSASTKSNISISSDGTVALSQNVVSGDKFQPDGVHYYLTTAEINRMKDQIFVQKLPWAVEAWNQTKAVADQYVNASPSPADGYPANYNNQDHSATDCSVAVKSWFNCLYKPGTNDGFRVLALSRAYALTGNQAYGDKAKQYILAWARTYNPPATQVGHGVAEAVGFGDKTFLAYDLVRDHFSASEQAEVSSWAHKVMVNNMRLVDTNIDSDSNPQYRHGNGAMWERSLAVLAGAAAGGQDAQDVLDWNWQHTSPKGRQYGWDAVLELAINNAQGKIEEENTRHSIGYALYTWHGLVLTADVARHLGFSHDLFNHQTASGKNLRAVTEHYVPYLINQVPNPYPEKEPGQASPSGYQAYATMQNEYRAAYELAYQVWPDSDLIKSVINFGSDTARGSRNDNHITQFNAITGIPTTGGETATPLPTFDVDLPPNTIDSTDIAAWNRVRTAVDDGNPNTQPSAADQSRLICQQAAWVRPTSPANEKFRQLRNGANGERALKVSGSDSQDEWWVLLEQKFDSDYPEHTGSSNGGWYVNFHDDPNTTIDPVHAAPSAILVGYRGIAGTHRIQIADQNVAGGGDLTLPLPDPVKGKWFSLTLHVIFGRSDGSTPRAGLVEAWMNGDKVADSRDQFPGGINDIYRNTNPANGPVGLQQWVQLWQGGPYLPPGYATSSIPAKYGWKTPCLVKTSATIWKSSTVAARIGPTFAQALTDTQIDPNLGDANGSSHIDGIGLPDYGDSTYTLSSTPRTTADFIIPSDLAGQVSGITTYPASGSLTLPYDAGQGAHFSNFIATDSKPSGTNITYQARSSCDNSTWSSWGAVSSVPDGKYLQLKANLTTTNSSATPSIDKLSIDYDTSSTACQSDGGGGGTGGTITDGQAVTIIGPTRLLDDNSNVIITDATGGHRLYPTATITDADIRAIAGQTITVKGTAVITDPNDPNLQTHYPIKVTSINDSSSRSKTGDINSDNKVDISDLSILLSHFNGSGSGDINGDRSIDVLDLSILLSNFGK